VRASPPEKTHSPYMHMTQAQLAGALELEPDQVRLAAAHVATDDTFVFRVLDIEAFNDQVFDVAEVEQVAEEARRAHEAAAERLADARERMEEVARARTEALNDAREHRTEAAAAAAEARAEARAEALAQRQAAAAERLAA